MTGIDREAMIKRFNDFEKSQPEQLIIRKARINGGDLVLDKKMVDGVAVYVAPLAVPLLDEM